MINTGMIGNKQMLYLGNLAVKMYLELIHYRS